MLNNNIKKIENLSFKNNEYLIRWQMTTLCNYYCDFCIQGNKEKHIKRSKGENTKTRSDICDSIIKFIEDKLNNKYKTLRIDLIGGEITILSEFIIILEKFINCQFAGNLEIHITTNLSTDIKTLEQMKKVVKNKKNRKLSISASFYKEFTNEEEFIKRVKIFTKNNFNNKLIKKILQIKSNIVFTINISLIEDNDYDLYEKFKRKYNNIADSIKYVVIRKYKKTISDELKGKLITSNEKTIKVTLKDGSIKYYTRTSKISLDIEDSEFFNPNGFLCNSGVNNIYINNLGEISRCPSCHKITRVGVNILDDNFEVITKKFKCPNISCNCDSYGIIENKSR